MSRPGHIRVRVQFRSAVTASPDCLANTEARELVLERLQEEVLDHRIKLLWARCCSFMKAKRNDDARIYCAQATTLTHSRSASHVRRLEVAKGLACAPETDDPLVGRARRQGGIHA